VPGPQPEIVERLRQERRRARNEEPHRPAIVGAERRQREKPRVESRHAHHRRGARQQSANFVGVELREPKHPRARQQRAVARDEQPVHVIDRQRMQQDIAAGEAPELNQRQRIAREVAMGEHRALGSTGRPRRVEDRRHVVGLRYDRVKGLRMVGRPIEQRSRAARERQHLGLGAKRRDALGGLGAADDHRRLPRRRKDRRARSSGTPY
jgi:hypothetical protein